MSVVGINRITYSTDRTDDARRFYADWGLTPLGNDVWETLDGAQVQVVAPDAPYLPPAFEPGPTLRQVQWAVSSAQALREFANVLPLSTLENGVLTALDPHGLSIQFALDARRKVDVKGSVFNPYGREGRIDAPSPVYERATPIEIGHVVLFTDRLAEAEAFYAKLGFVVSDRYPGRGVFMRGAPEGGHHDLFMLQLPNKPAGLNHVAFIVRDIHEVFGGGLAMSRCGWKTQLGPGRHPISSAYFWYFENPCGGLIEYNADEDHLTEKWQPREFTPGPTMFAEWAIDGGIDGHTRRQPSVAQSGAFLTEKRGR